MSRILIYWNKHHERTSTSINDKVEERVTKWGNKFFRQFDDIDDDYESASYWLLYEHPVEELDERIEQFEKTLRSVTPRVITVVPLNQRWRASKN
jgi:hypothetical protein